MKGLSLRIKNKRVPLPAVAAAALLLLALLFLLVGGAGSVQSAAPVSAGIRLCGEYKIGDGEWQPITPDGHISATSGDVTLRGCFYLFTPDTDEQIGFAPSGLTISLYLNHIGGYIVTPTGETLLFDAENPDFGEDACGTMWGWYSIVEAPAADGVPEDDASLREVTVVLTNPHRFGNSRAVDEFLQNMTLEQGAALESSILSRGSFERNLALFIIIASLIILGIALFSTFINVKSAKEMWLVGLMSFFAGGYFLFDAFGVSTWNNSNITNTRALGLCMMFYVLFCSALVCCLLRGKARRTAFAVSVASGVCLLLCLLLSFFKEIKFFDTWAVWAAVETVLVIILICCILGCFKQASTTQRLLYAVSILPLSAFPLDVLATAVGWWDGGIASKHVFIAVFMMALIIVLRIIPNHINVAIRARQLEAEQQALRLELQESRISIMLSQMQPHFIFNTLNTIYHLCEINPDTARKTISSFSEYLRNNIDTLGQSEMISFEKELSFVRTYLDIEKVRFDDELEIVFDVAVTNFKLPVLTVQPIVENAVKHGTSKREGTAQLCLSTRETEKGYEIVISDTGVGFDTAGYSNDGHKHVGISSVRQRLENLCGGSLTIQSTLGVGTRATIFIPKKEDTK